MKQKFIYNLIMVVCMALPCAGQQKDYRERVSFNGNHLNLQVCNGGKVYASNRFVVFCADSLKDDYRELFVGGGVTDIAFLEQLRDSIMIIAGHIDSDDHDGVELKKDAQKMDYILRSVDGGEHWDSICFSDKSCYNIFSIYTDHKDRIWVSGNNKKIDYSEDAGLTWKHYDLFTDEERHHLPKNGLLYIEDIFFEEDGKTGWIGSSMNKIYMTRDNCLTHDTIPTPVDQNKCGNIDCLDYMDIVICKFRPIGNKYIVSQDGKVFISDRDNINWQRVDSISEYELMDDGLIVFSKNGFLAYYDKDLNEIWSYDLHRYNASAVLCFRVSGGKVYAMTYPYTVYCFDGKTVESSEMFRKDKKLFEEEMKNESEADEIEYEVGEYEPYKIIRCAGKEFRPYDIDILCRTSDSDGWYRYVTLDAKAHEMWSENDRLYVTDRQDRVYEINPEVGIATRVKYDTRWFDNKKVEGITFTYSANGCFHSISSSVEYQLHGDRFVRVAQSNRGHLGKKRKLLKTFPKTISAEAVNELLTLIDDSRLSVDTAAFRIDVSPKERDEYRAFIEEIAKTNSEWSLAMDDLSLYGGAKNADLYVSLVDSIANMDDSEFYKVLGTSSGIYSTSIDTHWIDFKLSDGSTFNIYNDDTNPNYLYSPWKGDNGRIPFCCSSLTIGQKIDDMTDGRFFEKRYKSKSYAIYRLVDYLVRKMND